MSRSIESGTFTMRAAGPAEMVKSPEKGTPGVQVMCTYLDGPNVNRQIEWIGWLTDDTASRTAESLANMGYDGSDLSTVTRLAFQGVTEYETYDKADGSQGERARLKWINGGSRMTAMTAAEAGDAKQRLRMAFVAAKAKAAKAAKAAASSFDGDEPAF